jgi:alpha-tubulin suppressor-like RCC1 family protein/sugar lactone lactonase YvrE
MLVVFAVLITAEVSASMIVVTTTSDEASDSTYGSSTGAGISLREAVMQAANNPGDDDIFLNSGSTYTLTIAGRDENSNLTGDIDISDSSGSVTIHGQNAIVQAGTNTSNGIDRMFHIVSGTVYINRITLRYGLVTGSTWTETGGAIHNLGTTTMKNCTLHDSSAEYSAGAFSNRSGTLNLIQCTIYNNTANAGGGAYNGSGSTLNITNCTISGNYTTGGNGYGFIYNDGDVNMMNTTLSNNCEFSSIYRRNGIFTITNCLIEGALSSSSNGVGEIYSGGYNIIGYLKSEIFNETTGDIVGTDSTPANIGINTTLTNNGGPTKTHALLSTSDGRDTGTSSGAPLRDQRGYLRSSIDKGAFEYGATASSAPTDINISSNSVDDNCPSNTTIGTLSATDSDSGETYSFALVPGTGSTDNNSFYIDGNLLKTKEVIDYNTKSSYSIRLWVDDGISTYEKQMTISVNPNNPPTDISLSSDTIDENMAAGTSIGDFSTTDVDTLNTHTYTFISGTGDIDNASFAISGNTLQSAAEFDYEAKNSYSIRVRTTDNSGDYYDKIFTITINDIDDSFFTIHPSSTQNQTQSISIPITMNNITNIDIQAIELNISYDPAVLTATGISLTGTVLENENYIYDYNTQIPGIIYTGFMSNASHFTGTGLCLYADFTVIGASGETSDITISTAIINNQAVSTSEGIFTVAPDAPPIFTGMIPHTINEDALLSTSLTINDYETNPCDLTLTISSSDESLVAANTISYTCQSGNYYFAITPVSDQYGLATITIIAEDSGGLTVSASFDLTVVSVNDAPIITANTSLTMNEDSIGAFSLTVTDIETAGCSLGITWHSSDSSVMTDENISYTCAGDVFYFSLTPVENQSGNVTLSITVTDSGSLAQESIEITVTSIPDPPVISNISDLTMTFNTVSSIDFSVTDADSVDLTVSIQTSNSSLAALESISLSGTGSAKTLTITPSTDETGSSIVTITASDSDGLTSQSIFVLSVVPDRCEIIDIAAGQLHTLALLEGGTLKSWGYNNLGCLGDGTLLSSSTPVNVTNISDVTSIMAYDHNIALKSDGTVWTWGSNTNGQIGDGTTTSISIPYQVSINNIIAIGRGNKHSFAVKSDGTVMGWGLNDYYQLADGTTNDRYTAVAVSDLTNVVAVSGGYQQSLAITTDGQVKSWGKGIFGMLGLGNSTDMTLPTLISSLSNVTAVCGSTYQSYALKDDGTVWSTGTNSTGQLGDGTTTASNIFIQASITDVVSISVLYYHVIALKNDGTAWVWGSNDYGQLGDGTTNNSSTPIQFGTFTNVIAVAAGKLHSVVLLSDGSIWASGYNNFGQLGDGTTTDSLTPVQVVGLTPNYIPIIKSISEQTINEDEIANTITFVASDVEDSDCAMTLTFISSNPTLVPDENISYVCDTNNYTITAIPDTDQNGVVTITVNITDTESGSASRSFDLTVTAIQDAPVIGVIDDQVIFENAIAAPIDFTIVDADGDDLTLSISSSNSVLLPVSSINYTSLSSSYFMTLTPATNQSGTATVTLVVTDSTGLSDTTSFMVNVNTAPELSNISNIGTAVSEISFTIMEAEGDSVSITITSSDQSLISDANIIIIGANQNTIQLTPTAGLAQNLSIQLNQEINAHGLATITVEASAVGGTVTETFNVIVSPPGSGNALTFDGDDDFIAFGSIDGSHPLALAGSQFSMAFWIKPAITGDSFQRIIDKSTAGLAENGYLLCLNSGNSLKFYLNSMARFTTEPNVLTANRWHHVVVTGDSSQYNCYVNGVAVGLTTENAFELPPNATANLYMGTWYTETTREYKGQMDEVSIWNRALSETDIRDIMCQRLIGTENGLLAYYRFDHVSGTVLTDLSGNNYNGTLTNMDNTKWVTSCAALGDSSHYDYNGSVASDFSVTLSHSDGDAFTAVGDSGSYSGLHVYLVNESPSSYTAPAGFSGLYTDHYYGVFPVGITPTYSIAYNYSGNTSIASENGLRLASRSNQAGSWADSMADVYTSTTTISKTGISAFNGISATEFIPGGNLPPSFGSVSGQTIYEDSALISLPIVVTDSETATCSLGITFNTSQPALLSVADISYTCNANTIYVSLTPVTNQSGTVDVVIIASDAAGLASSSAFVLTVTDINDAPVMGSISSQATDEDIAIDSIAFTATDLETAACSLNITFISSDPTLISDTNLSYICDADQYTITAIPKTNQNGVATITVIVSDSDGLTTSTSFDLTVSSINDAPEISEFYTVQPGETIIAFNNTSDLTTYFNPDSSPVFTNESSSGLNSSGGVTFSSATETWTFSDGFSQSNGATYTVEAYFYNEWNSGWTGMGFAIADQNEPDGTAGEPAISIGVGFHGGGGAFLNNGSSAALSWSPDLVAGNWYKIIYCLTNNGDNTFDELFEIYNSDTSGTLGTLKTSHAQTGTLNTDIAQASTIYAYFSNSGSRMSAMDEFAVSASTGGNTVISNAFTIDEDTIADAILFTIADVEGDNLTLSVHSSNLTLVAIENITIAGTGSSRTLTITPTANENGVVTITVDVTDGSFTSSSALRLTVLELNDPPQMGSIADQTTLEDIATSVISFTVVDNETASCDMTLIMKSSDQALVPDAYLLSICSGNEYSIVATPARDQYGTATISVTITDAGGLAVSTSFMVTVTDIDDSQYIWANQQAANLVLGQTDFISNNSGATAYSFLNPIALAVDQTTGKVFISDRENNRILRFSSTSAAISGSSAEAVLGQPDFTSVQINRGMSVGANTLSNPNGLFVDSFGRLWVADRGNHRILRFDNASSKLSGANADYVLGQSDFVTNSSGTTQNTMNEPHSVWVDPVGILWVADLGNHRVLRFDDAASKSNGANADGVLGQPDFTSATAGTTQSICNGSVGVFVNNSDYLFVADYSNHRVLGFSNASLKSNGASADKVLGQSDFVTNTPISSSVNMTFPVHGILDNTGRLYVSDGGNHRIMIFNDVLNLSNGAAADHVLGQPNFTSNTANNGGISERTLYGNHFLYFDNLNNSLWVAEYNNNRVLRYTMMIKTPPVISSIVDSVMDEDTVANNLSFTVTDINEQTLTITYNSSDTNLISSSSISFSGNHVSTDGIAYTVTATAVPTNVTLIITPESNQSGTAYITITVTDPNGMTATQSFSLTVTEVNDVPTLSTVDPQSLNEGTSINITLTTSDIEGDALSVTVVSSNQSLIQDSDILLANNGNTYTITITPMMNQSGSTDITISVSDGTDITRMTFLITVNEVYYMIAGHVSSYTDIAGSDLQGVTLTLSGTHSYSMVTDATGYYTFSTVRPGDYTLTASKSDDINLEIADAVQILKATVKKISLTCLEQIAADAYIDGRYGAYDAALVAGYVAGINTCLNDSCTFWQFVPEIITSCETWPLIEFENVRRYTDLTGDAVGQDFIGIGCGNVAE